MSAGLLCMFGHGFPLAQLEELAGQGGHASPREIITKVKVLLSVLLESISDAAFGPRKKDGGRPPFAAFVQFLAAQGPESRHGRLFLSVLRDYDITFVDFVIIQNSNADTTKCLYDAFAAASG